MEEGGDLFEEIKKMRNVKHTVATSVDGEVDNIQEHFKTIYDKLYYNSADDTEELKKVEELVKKKVNISDLDTVNKVTPEIVEMAAHKLKPNKGDPVFSFSSDCLKSGTKVLYEKLSILLRSFLIHGHVTLILLLTTLVPLVKDKLASLNSSKNYRSVALSSLLIKLVDWIVIILEGESLGLNELQFAYQANCSTTMCTWAVMETVSYFLNNGSEVFTCATDMTKAFDLTLHSIMFKKMVDIGLSVIIVRLLIFIYTNQVANVRWNGEVSSSFKVSNGCGQGKIIAAVAYCLYCEDLFSLLKRRRSGCWIREEYRGFYGYSDDNWAVAPSLQALQDILNTCEEYAASNLQFSTDINPQKCK